jgi:hypothetical protein
MRYYASQAILFIINGWPLWLVLFIMAVTAAVVGWFLGQP